MRIPLKYNLRSLFVRRGTALMTIASVAFVVLVYIGVLALAGGLESAFAGSGDPRNVIVLREGAQSETTSYFELERAREAAALEGIETGADGQPIASGEVVILQNFARADGSESNVVVRGVGEAAFALRPQLRIVEGRRFEPGRAELIVARRLADRFPTLALGRTVDLGRLPFRVVGVFEAGGSSFDSEAWGSTEDVLDAYRRQGYYSSLLVRTASPAAAAAYVERVKGDQRLHLNALPEDRYFRQQTEATARQFIWLGNALAVIMAFGACFAAANTMYASVSARTREIGTLRVLGFRRRTILGAIVVEAALLGLIAGGVGALLALPLNAVSTGTTNFVTFSEIAFSLRTTPEVLIGGIVLAIVTGVIGGLAPAWSASRMPIREALRTA